MMNGYELAKILDDEYRYSPNHEMIQSLEEMDGHVDDLYKKELQAWVLEKDIQPPFSIGTQIKQGEIAGIYEYGVATYKVKKYGCTEEGTFRLIKFEDAQYVEVAA